MNRRKRKIFLIFYLKRWHKREITEEERVGRGGGRGNGKRTSGKNNQKVILNQKTFRSSGSFTFNWHEIKSNQ